CVNRVAHVRIRPGAYDAMVFLERDRSAPELAEVEACPPREREAERCEHDSHPEDPRLRGKERHRQRPDWRTKQQERPDPDRQALRDARARGLSSDSFGCPA